MPSCHYRDCEQRPRTLCPQRFSQLIKLGALHPPGQITQSGAKRRAVELRGSYVPPEMFHVVAKTARHQPIRSTHRTSAMLVRYSLNVKLLEIKTNLIWHCYGKAQITAGCKHAEKRVVDAGTAINYG